LLPAEYCSAFSRLIHAGDEEDGMNKTVILAASILAASCGGGGGYDSGSGSGSSAALNYTVGGNVSGLNGTLVLQDNGGDNLTITQNGAFTFGTPIGYANGYDVTVLTQPTGQTCTVANGTGAFMGTSINNVTVTCR
jgi:hypothetical protein